MENLDIATIKRNIIYGVNKDWPELYKARYAYLMLGKYLSKDTDFFFSTENKLGELNLSMKEIKQRYNMREGKNNYVTCVSASYLLFEILYALNITSYLVKSKNNKIEVNLDNESFDVTHYILAIEADGKKYFASLSADLPYIQQGMKTQHFGVNIPYYKTLSDGSKQQVYEGEEIKHTVLSEEELKEIDIEVGYLKSYYKIDNNNNSSKDFYLQYEDSAFELLKAQLSGNRLYYNLRCQLSPFYKTVYPIKYKNGTEYDLIDIDKVELTDKEINGKIHFICLSIDGILSDLTGLITHSIAFNDEEVDFNEWIKEKCELLKGYILGEHKDDEKYKIDENFDYPKWSRAIKKDNIYKETEEYKNVLLILDKTNALVKQIKNKDPQDITTLLTKLSFHTLNEDFILPKDKNTFISNKYIASKLALLFPYIFSANEIITDFNEENYSEKIVIIKKIIEMMFSELTVNNSKMNGYNPKYSAVMNRIQLYAVKNTDDLSYQIVINIVGNNELGDYYFLYNPKGNTFGPINILDFSEKKYIFVSDRLKEILKEETKKR